ncbi:hypothetical protein PIB30_103146, partial [Stylosanthes scabra]|nr:hypothetical protein [Stylosanthes scabra]
AITADDRLEYRPSWISEDSHVWMTFKVHKRVMEDRFMEFYVEVYQVVGSSGFCLFVPPTTHALIHVVALDDVAMQDYNFKDNSNYEEESLHHSTENDEEVPNTPTVGGS